MGETMVVAVGECVSLRASLSDDKRRLGQVAWHSSAPQIAHVVPGAGPDLGEVRATRPGRATITVMAGDVQAAVEIEVKPGTELGLKLALTPA